MDQVIVRLLTGASSYNSGLLGDQVVDGVCDVGGESLDGARERESIGLVEVGGAVDGGHASIGDRDHSVGGGLDGSWAAT